MKEKIPVSIFLRKLPVAVLLLHSFFSCTTDGEQTNFSTAGESVPVSLSVQMSGKEFESSTDIIPMQAKAGMDSYYVVKFTAQSTLLILKQKGSGWVIERRIDDLYPSFKIQNGENLALESQDYILRPGIYRFVLFANYRSGLNGIEEGSYFETPEKEIVVSYNSILGTSNKMLLGEELFVGKTENIRIGRTEILDSPDMSRRYSIELKRVVSMLRLSVTTDNMTGSVKLGYFIESQSFCSGVNLFGEVLKTETPLVQIYGVSDMLANPFDIDGRNFYFGSVSNNITNRPRYILMPDEIDDNPDCMLHVIQANDLDIPPLTVTFPLKRNAINGVALEKSKNQYSIYSQDGKPYPVDDFPAMGGKSDYIELNNGD